MPTNANQFSKDLKRAKENKPKTKVRDNLFTDYSFLNSDNHMVNTMRTGYNLGLENPMPEQSFMTRYLPELSIEPDYIQGSISKSYGPNTFGVSLGTPFEGFQPNIGFNFSREFAYGGDPSLPALTGHYPFGGQYTKTHTHMKDGGWLDEYDKGGKVKNLKAERSTTDTFYSKQKPIFKDSGPMVEAGFFPNQGDTPEIDWILQHIEPFSTIKDVYGIYDAVKRLDKADLYKSVYSQIIPFLNYTDIELPKEVKEAVNRTEKENIDIILKRNKKAKGGSINWLDQYDPGGEKKAVNYLDALPKSPNARRDATATAMNQQGRFLDEAMKYNMQKEADYQKTIGDKTGEAEIQFRERYKTSPHAYRQSIDPKYRKEVEAQAKRTGKQFGEIKKKAEIDPNAMFMIPATGITPEGMQEMQEYHGNVIGSALPVPGLERMGKIPGALDALSGIMAKVAKAGSKEKAAAKLAEDKLFPYTQKQADEYQNAMSQIDQERAAEALREWNAEQDRLEMLKDKKLKEAERREWEDYINDPFEDYLSQREREIDNYLPAPPATITIPDQNIYARPVDAYSNIANVRVNTPQYDFSTPPVPASNYITNAPTPQYNPSTHFQAPDGSILPISELQNYMARNMRTSYAATAAGTGSPARAAGMSSAMTSNPRINFTPEGGLFGMTPEQTQAALASISQNLPAPQPARRQITTFEEARDFLSSPDRSAPDIEAYLQETGRTIDDIHSSIMDDRNNAITFVNELLANTDQYGILRAPTVDTEKVLKETLTPELQEFTKKNLKDKKLTGTVAFHNTKNKVIHKIEDPTTIPNTEDIPDLIKNFEQVYERVKGKDPKLANQIKTQLEDLRGTQWLRTISAEEKGTRGLKNADKNMSIVTFEGRKNLIDGDGNVIGSISLNDNKIGDSGVNNAFHGYNFKRAGFKDELDAQHQLETRLFNEKKASIENDPDAAYYFDRYPEKKNEIYDKIKKEAEQEAKQTVDRLVRNNENKYGETLYRAVHHAIKDTKGPLKSYKNFWKSDFEDPITGIKDSRYRANNSWDSWTRSGYTKDEGDFYEVVKRLGGQKGKLPKKLTTKNVVTGISPLLAKGPMFQKRRALFDPNSKYEQGGESFNQDWLSKYE